MRILLVGSGGREHALAWRMAQGGGGDRRVFVAPGNAGTAGEAGVENVDIAATDLEGLADFAAREKVDLTISGAETPLTLGIADLFAERGLRCLGPSRAAARLEGSKVFAKEFLQRHGIASAGYRSFADLGEAMAAVGELGAGDFPVAIKADGLAGGKGVVIAGDAGEAEAALREMLQEGRFGAAGERVVVEEFLQGEEVSFICLVDGKDVLPMASSQDHKAAFDGDAGPNTGGMGAYSPSPLVDGAMHEEIMRGVIRPTVAGMAAEGMEYRGFLYAGLMVGEDGVARVLEYNCRFGDPETQPIMLRLRSDLAAHCLAAAEGRLAGEEAEWDARAALGVVMAAEGYPGEVGTRGAVIRGLGGVGNGGEGKVFHAGTGAGEGDDLVVTGGRVLCATACGESVGAAQKAAYDLVEQINWVGCWYRSDIGYRAVRREAAANSNCGG